MLAVGTLPVTSLQKRGGSGYLIHDPKDYGLIKTDKLLVGRGAQPCAPTENAEVIKFLFLS